MRNKLIEILTRRIPKHFYARILQPHEIKYVDGFGQELQIDFEALADDLIENDLEPKKRLITNADQIRAMNDEGLADEFFKFGDNAYTMGVYKKSGCLDTREEILKWLQQPAEGV